MKRWKRSLTAGLALCIASGNAAAVSAEETHDVKKYTYHFCPHEITDTDYTDEISYSDEFFSGTAAEYNEHLATASMSLASSSISANTYRSEDLTVPYYEDGALQTASINSGGDLSGYWYRAGNLQELLTELGFEDFEVNKNYVTQPQEQTIGVGVAIKKIRVNCQDYTMIAIIPRSAGYEKEWAGNFTIGRGEDSEGFAEGFYNARQEIIRFSADYIQRHHIIGKVKIWTAGYSRGAAAANLTAGWYADNASTDPRLQSISLDRSDIYAYTFGTPAGVWYGSDTQLKEKLHTDYSFIHNVFASYDPVPMLALDQWGFTRYGTDIALNAGYDTAVHKDTANDEMKALLKNLNPTVYSIYDTGGGDPNSFEPKKFVLSNGKISIVSDTSSGIKSEFLSQETFLKNRLQFVYKNLIHSRTDYENYQSVLQAFMVMYLGDYSARPSDLIANLSSDTLTQAAAAGMYIYYIVRRYSSSLTGIDTGSAENQELIKQLVNAAKMAHEYLNDLSSDKETNITLLLQQYSGDSSLTIETVRDAFGSFEQYLNNTKSLTEFVSVLKDASRYCLGAAVTKAMQQAGYTEEEISRLVGTDASGNPDMNNMGWLIDFLSYLMLGSDGVSTETEQYNLVSISEEGSVSFNLESDELRVLATLVGNGGSYMRVHNNEVILAWLRTQDRYYSGAADKHPTADTCTSCSVKDYTVPNAAVYAS